MPLSIESSRSSFEPSLDSLFRLRENLINIEAMPQTKLLQLLVTFLNPFGLASVSRRMQIGGSDAGYQPDTFSNGFVDIKIVS
jgi:hypothetical protein